MDGNILSLVEVMVVLTSKLLKMEHTQPCGAIFQHVKLKQECIGVCDMQVRCIELVHGFCMCGS